MCAIGFPSAEPSCSGRRKVPFVPIGTKEYPAGSAREVLHPLRKCKARRL